MPVWGLWKMISFTSMRKERILRCWGIILPVALLIYIMLCRFLPGCARGYADYVYPNVSFVLSAVSSVIPVSWEEIMAVVVVSLMIFIPVMARRRGEGWLVIFRRLTLLVLWIIIWFYMAWGLNYFRPSLYARCNLRPVEYEEEVFMKFLDVYTEGLNASFTHDTGIEKRRWRLSSRETMPVFLLVMGWPVRNRGSISSILDLPRYIRVWAYWVPWDRFCRGTSE